MTMFVAMCLLLAAIASSIGGTAQAQAGGRWWFPGDGRTLPANLDYANADGVLGVLNTAGAIDTRSPASRSRNVSGKPGGPNTASHAV